MDGPEIFIPIIAIVVTLLGIWLCLDSVRGP